LQDHGEVSWTFLILGSLVPPYLQQCSQWSYEGPHGPENWKKGHFHCGKGSQSPIDVETEVVRYDPSLRPIQLEGYSKPDSNLFTLSNNGHTVQLTLPSTMSISSLSQPYTAVQLHFHWGSLTATEGSEHQVDGHSAHAELHVVHYNSEKYLNVKEAMSKEDGLVVLGILMEVGELKNPAYENILSHLESVKFAGQEVTIPSFDVQSLLPKQLDKYFTYNGSLTTPPCFQSVQWIVFHQRVLLSLSQLTALKTKLFSTAADTASAQPLINNFRETQPLNNRVVKASFPLGWAINFRKAMLALMKILSTKFHQVIKKGFAVLWHLSQPQDDTLKRFVATVHHGEGGKGVAFEELNCQRATFPSSLQRSREPPRWECGTRISNTVHRQRDKGQF
ncbi:carbonic anhydrase 14-like, partial [Carcharodon carcharias]|uniref:carbonic anhydrase 14-like n=1 Tax=Carcharodon carcharias TaxID=13397 RepID=UPI001B7D9C0E